MNSLYNHRNRLCQIKIWYDGNIYTWEAWRDKACGNKSSMNPLFKHYGGKKAVLRELLKHDFRELNG